MDSPGVENGKRARDLKRSDDTSSGPRDSLIDLDAASTSPTIVATDRYRDPLAEFAEEPVAPVRSATPADRRPPAYEGNRAASRRPLEVAGAPQYDAPAFQHSDDVYPDLPLVTPGAAAYPPQPANIPRERRSWAGVLLIGAASAAFAGGAYLYATYPWLPANERSRAPVTSTADTQEPPRSTAATAPSTEAAIPGDTSPAPAVVADDRADDDRRDAIPRSRGAARDSQSLSGEWAMNTRVESSRLSRYEGLRLAYRLRLQQVGNQVTGTGYKLRENDRAVLTQTPITLIGEVEGDRVVITFTERGTRRPSTGKLVLDRASDGVLRGRFSSDAAQSHGVVEARR